MRNFIIIVVICVVLGGIRGFMSGGSIPNQLKKAEAQINKTCPQMIDEYTRMDRVKAGEREITYYYTVIGIEDEALVNGKEEMIKVATKTLRGNPETKRILDKKITMNYVYSNQNGKQILTFAIKD